MLTVRDLLKSKGEGVWAVSPETTTIDALRFLAEKKVGALLVIEDGILSGIISERDFVHRVAQEGALDMQTPIREYMTSKVITVTPEDSIEACMQIMTDRRIRHLPVLNNSDLVGIISIGDLVKGIISEQKILINDLENYITGTGYGH
jgi:CBS domain-containing protein